MNKDALHKFIEEKQPNIDEKKEIYSAIGNSGNVIYINKLKNIVVSVTSYFKPTVFDRVDFIRDYIEPVL